MIEINEKEKPGITIESYNKMPPSLKVFLKKEKTFSESKPLSPLVIKKFFPHYQKMSEKERNEVNFFLNEHKDNIFAIINEITKQNNQFTDHIKIISDYFFCCHAIDKILLKDPLYINNTFPMVLNIFSEKFGIKKIVQQKLLFSECLLLLSRCSIKTPDEKKIGQIFLDSIFGELQKFFSEKTNYLQQRDNLERLITILDIAQNKGLETSAYESKIHQYFSHYISEMQHMTTEKVESLEGNDDINYQNEVNEVKKGENSGIGNIYSHLWFLKTYQKYAGENKDKIDQGWDYFSHTLEKNQGEYLKNFESTLEASFHYLTGNLYPPYQHLFQAILSTILHQNLLGIKILRTSIML